MSPLFLRGHGFYFELEAGSYPDDYVIVQEKPEFLYIIRYPRIAYRSNMLMTKYWPSIC